MVKKILFALNVVILMAVLVGCRQPNEEVNVEEEIEIEEVYDSGPTPEELRAAFEMFYNENKENIINRIATEGEDVRLELAAGYEFTMTIVLDDIELTDRNRASYILAFELQFSEWGELLSGLAQDIKEEAGIGHFTLTVRLVDVNEIQIIRSSFEVGTRQNHIVTPELD